MAKLFLICSLVLLAAISWDATVNACCDQCLDPTAPLYRYFDPITGDHYYTLVMGDTPSQGLNDEGVAGYVFATAADGTVPFYLYFNGVDHFYTTDIDDQLGGQDGYTFIGIAAYIYPKSMCGTIPLYLYYNACSQDHFYTTNLAELGAGMSGYKFLGVAGYVYPDAQGDDPNIFALREYYSPSREDSLLSIETDPARITALGDGTYTGIPSVPLGYCFKDPACGTMPLFNYYSDTQEDNFYTTNYYGELGPGSKGYIIQGITCYIYPNATDNTVALHRYYSGSAGDHYYDIDPLVSEFGSADIYDYELIAGYILKNMNGNGNCCGSKFGCNK